MSRDTGEPTQGTLPSKGRRRELEPHEGKTMETGAPKVTVSTKLERIAKLAKDKPGVALTTLTHHIDMEWLRRRTRR